MLKSIFNVLQTNCLTYCLYLLLASTIVTKSINCFVLENTEWSTVIKDINTHGTSDNATTTTTIDDSTDDASTDLLRKLTEDTNNVGNEHSAPANDVTLIDDIETGKYWLISLPNIIIVKWVFGIPFWMHGTRFDGIGWHSLWKFTNQIYGDRSMPISMLSCWFAHKLAAMILCWLIQSSQPDMTMSLAW